MTDILVAAPMNFPGVSKGGGFAAGHTATRPNDTAAYLAGDVVAGVMQFDSIGPAGGHVLITSVDHRIDLAAVPSGMVGFRLHLYNATPPSAYADNAAWDLPAGDRAIYLGYIDLPAPVDMGSTLYSQLDSVNIQRKLETSSLYGYLVTLGAYTPSASTVRKVKLRTVGL
jgi:hypothetical protein